MKFGLKGEDLNYIVTEISKFSEIKKAVIFGSRAKGNYKPGSDIDIALFGDEVNFNVLSKLHSLLEDESPMPYFFDILDYTHTINEEIKKHIDWVGIPIYEAK